MSTFKIFLILAIVFVSLQSCLVSPAPKYHYFVATDNLINRNPEVTIFSTPRYKDYVVTGIDMNEKVFIKSAVFQNPGEFYAMENDSTSAKHYKYQRRDGKFYHAGDYTSLTLKITGQHSERIINYKIADK